MLIINASMGRKEGKKSALNTGIVIKSIVNVIINVLSIQSLTLRISVVSKWAMNLAIGDTGCSLYAVSYISEWHVIIPHREKYIAVILSGMIYLVVCIVESGGHPKTLRCCYTPSCLYADQTEKHNREQTKKQTKK